MNFSKNCRKVENVKSNNRALKKNNADRQYFAQFCNSGNKKLFHPLKLKKYTFVGR